MMLLAFRPDGYTFPGDRVSALGRGLNGVRGRRRGNWKANNARD